MTLAVPWDAVSFPLLFGVPGALIAARAPRQPTGWLMLFISAGFAGNAATVQLLASGHHSAWYAWWAGRASAVLVPATLLLVLVLPDGRLPSTGWRPLVRVVLGIQGVVIAVASLTPGPAAPDEDLIGAENLLNPIGVLPEAWHPVLVNTIGPVLILPFLLGAAAVVQRLRHPDVDERPKLVSILLSLLVFVLFVTVPDLAWPSAAVWFHIAGTALLCGAIQAAVVRGQLGRMQVVVSHALVYGLLTVTVVAAYVLLVALSTRDLAGPLAAGVALALLPARGLLQRALRRAMYGDRGQPHVALRRLSTEIAESDELEGVLSGLARSVRASLRASWVEVEFRECRTQVGEATPRARVEVRPLDGGVGVGGQMLVGLAPGRRLKRDEANLLDDLADHGARSARVVCIATDLAVARQELVEGREEERSRLRRDLHDELGPVLAGLAMQLGSMPALVTADSGLAADRLSRLEGEARGALDRMRRLTRDLRPPALDELGLVGAVVELGRGLGITVNVTGTVVQPLSAAVEVAAYRIAAEAVLNAQRHAGVDQVALVVDVCDRQLTLSVADRGPGRRESPDGVGVQSMRTRAAELGGTLDVMPAVGGGTVVHAMLPCGGPG